jgi:K+-sensing histidine kinase KdpD
VVGLAVVKQIVDANDWRISSCAGRRTGASIRIHISAPAIDRADEAATT